MPFNRSYTFDSRRRNVLLEVESPPLNPLLYKSRLLTPPKHIDSPEELNVIKYGIFNSSTLFDLTKETNENDLSYTGKLISSHFTIKLPNEKQYYSIVGLLNYPSFILERGGELFLHFVMAKEYHGEDLSFNVNDVLKDKNLTFEIEDTLASIKNPFTESVKFLNVKTLGVEYEGSNLIEIGKHLLNNCKLYISDKDVFREGGIKKVSSHTIFKELEEFNKFKKTSLLHRQTHRVSYAKMNRPKQLIYEGDFVKLSKCIFNQTFDRKKPKNGYLDYERELGWCWALDKEARENFPEEALDLYIEQTWKEECKLREERGFNKDLTYLPQAADRDEEMAIRLFIRSSAYHSKFSISRYSNKTAKKNLEDFGVKFLDFFYQQLLSREYISFQRNKNKRRQPFIWKKEVFHFTPSSYFKKLCPEYHLYLPTLLKIFNIKRTSSYSNGLTNYYCKAISLNDVMETLIYIIDCYNYNINCGKKLRERKYVQSYYAGRVGKSIIKFFGGIIKNKKTLKRKYNIDISTYNHINILSLKNKVYMWMQRGSENNTIQLTYDQLMKNNYSTTYNDREEGWKEAIIKRDLEVKWTHSNMF